MRRWWQRRTLRFRLASWYALGGTLLFAGFGSVVYFYVAQRMARPLDHQLRQDLADVEARLAVRPDGGVLWDGREVALGTAWSWEDPWFEIWNDEGRLVRRFWPLEASQIEQPPLAPARGRQTLSVFFVAKSLRLRTLSVPYAVPGRPGVWMLRIMRVHKSAAEALNALLLIIAAALPLVIALLVLGGYIVTRRWLAPLDEMVAQANRINAEDLSRRLPVANPDDELGQLATVFNVTLDRLQDSFQALDRFVADASHELRTPLTTLRSVGEVGLHRGRTVEEYREIIGSMLEETGRLQSLTQRLLELARVEGGGESIQRRHIRLDEYVTSCVSELSVLAESRGQRITVDAKECSAEIDPILFRQALQNLLDNAIKFSPMNATIRVSVRDAGDRCDVAVTDEGPGVPPEKGEHLADRFYRPDRARGRGEGGFGLGLAITKAYMRALGGSLAYEPAQPRGSTFRLALPKTWNSGRPAASARV